MIYPMKLSRTALAACLLAATFSAVHAETPNERIEQAATVAAGYYGRAVVLNTVSQSKCKAQLTMPKSDYNLQQVRAEIARTLGQHFSKDVVQALPEIFAELDNKYSREDFSVAKVNAQVKDCQAMTDALVHNFVNGRKAWLAFFDKR